MNKKTLWTVIEHAYGDWNRIDGFKTKSDALFHLQCLRCSNDGATKVVSGEYEFLRKDLIVLNDGRLESMGYGTSLFKDMVNE